MASVGYRRDGDRYVHPQLPVIVEFPAGPLGIGEDLDIQPVLIGNRRARTLALSATDSCRDRLAAFYHWHDRQSLHAAVLVAAAERVRRLTLRRWSQRKGFADRYEEFERALARFRADRCKRRRPSRSRA